MRNPATPVITAVIAAAAAAGAAVYVLSSRRPRSGAAGQPPEKQDSFIYVERDANGNCKSTKYPSQGRVKKNGKVTWKIGASDDGKACLKNRKLMLKPKNGHQSPLDPPEPSDDKLIKATAMKATPDGHPYKYQVWLVEKDGTPVRMLEDPELEVIDSH